MNIVSLIASYQNLNIDPYWPDVVALLDCDAARFYFPQVICGSTAHGWVVAMQQSNTPSLPQVLWYQSSTVDGTFEFTGKITGVDVIQGTFNPDVTVKNSTTCLGMVPGSPGPIVFTSGYFASTPLDIVGSVSNPAVITPNIDPRDIRFLGTNGTDFYVFGSISGWTNPNEVYKSTDNGVNWSYLGTMSGATFPVAFGGTGNFGDAVLRKIGSRWFLIITTYGFAGSTDGRRVYYTDSTEPVTGWTAATGISIDPTNFNEQIARSITYDGISTYYLSKTRQTTLEMYRSTDGGASWTLDHTIARTGNEYVVCWDTTNPAVGGKVRATIAGTTGLGYWLEHTIGDPAGAWSTRSFDLQTPNWDVYGYGPANVFINNLNSGGIAAGNAPVASEPAGALTYTDGPSADLTYNPSPYYLYGQYPLQTALSTTITRFPAYPLAYIDTSFYKWGTVPGRKQHNTAAGSLRCNGAVTTLTTTVEWNLGNEDWTIECWMYTTVANQVAAVLSNLTGGGSSLYPFNFGLNNGKVSVYGYTAAGVLAYSIFEAATLPLSSWNFIAFQRSGSTITLYLNGVSVGSASITPGVSLYWNSDPLNIGAYNDNSYPLDGWLDDIRVTKGVARYSGNFEVPARPFADRGTDSAY